MRLLLRPLDHRERLAAASVPQALNLLSGPMVESLIHPNSIFGKRLHEAGSLEEKTRPIFQAMLTREPAEKELELVAA